MLLRLLRIPAAAIALLIGVVWIGAAIVWDRLWRRARFEGAARRAQAGWCRAFCRLLGMRLHVAGAPLASGPALLAANHISWLDIICVAACWPVAFLSKSEVRRWPLVGPVATGLGTLYIERGGSGAARRAVSAMHRRLAAGERVLFFPEGTTGDGSAIQPFRPRLYQAAIDAAVPVQPLAIAYRYPGGERCAEAPFLDGESLVANLWRVAGVPRMDILLHLGQELFADGERRALADHSRAAIEHKLFGAAAGVPVTRTA